MFTKGQYDLINKNLNFCSTPAHYNESILKNNLECFNKKIKLKAFFHEKSEQIQEAEATSKESIIKSKTNWEPKKNHHTAETFSEAANKDVVERFSYKNAIEHFSERNDLIITKADKEEETITLNLKDYFNKN